jgi:hypothetical protein
MKLSVLFVLFLTFVSNVLGSIAPNDEDALREACRELNGGGTKVRLEFDLSGACRGNCGGKKKRKKTAAE